MIVYKKFNLYVIKNVPTPIPYSNCLLLLPLHNGYTAQLLNSFTQFVSLFSFLYFFLLKRIWRGPASPWFFWWVWRERGEQMQIKRIPNSELPKTYQNSGVRIEGRQRPQDLAVEEGLCEFRGCAVGSVWISVTKRVPLTMSLRCLLSISLRCLLGVRKWWQG